MPYYEANDQTQLFYTDWGTGKPIVFAHAWAMSSAMWEHYMLYFQAQGMRCIAYDRRGHGRSDKPGNGFNYDQHADDLASLIEKLDLKEITLVGHSMGGGEIIRYLTRHGSDRVSRLALIAPTLPFLTKSADNPEGIETSLLDSVRDAMESDFPNWLNEGADGFYRPNTLGVSSGIIQWTLDMMLQTSLKAVIEDNLEVALTDFRPELKNIEVPTLLIHGDEDQSVPVIFGRKTAQLIPQCQYKEYKEAPHGLFYTHMDDLKKDLLSYISG